MEILGEVYAIPIKRNETGALIRLTLERWEHIVDEHSQDFSYSDYEIVLDAVGDPDYILRGRGGARRAVVNYGKRFLHVFYRKLNKQDGFIITAFYEPSFDRKLIIWRKDEHDRDS